MKPPAPHIKHRISRTQRLRSSQVKEAAAGLSTAALVVFVARVALVLVTDLVAGVTSAAGAVFVVGAASLTGTVVVAGTAGAALGGGGRLTGMMDKPSSFAVFLAGPSSSLDGL